MRHTFIITMSVLVFLLVGSCANQEKLTLTPKPLPEKRITPPEPPTTKTISETPEPSSTATALPPETATLTQSATLTPHVDIETSYPKARYIQKCVRDSRSSMDLALDGTLIGLLKGNYYFLRNGEAQKFLVAERSFGIEFSPDKQKIMMEDLEDGFKMIELSIQGEKIAEIDLNDQWKNISWLGNNFWLIHLRDRYDTLLIFDPINNKNISEIEIKDPQLFYFEGPKGQFYMPAQIDPDQKVVVYYSREEKGRLVLWDIKKQIELAHIAYYIPEEPFPPQDIDVPLEMWLLSSGWSPDGNYFVNPAFQTIAGEPITQDAPQELYQISLTGEIERLTYLSEVLDNVHFFHFEWSPNGEYIAFWFQESPKSSFKLGIYDFKNKLIIDYCIESETQSSFTWSPDGKKLIVQPEKENSDRRTILFDLKKESKLLLPDIYNSFIVGDWVLDSR